MLKQMLAGLLLGTLVLGSVGCSGTGAALEAFRIGKNLSESSNLAVFLDGKEAKQNKFKQGYFGYADHQIKETISTSPSFKFTYKDPTKFGRITGTNLQIHQAFEADYSHQAEFVVFPQGNNKDNLMRDNQSYNLGSLPGSLGCLDFDRNNVSGIQLKPGMDYMMVFSVGGDRSETVRVLFTTK